MDMLNMRWLFLSLVLVSGFAWSDIPGKAIPQMIGIYQGNQQAKGEQRGTQNSPVFVKGDVTTKQDKEQADKDAKEREIKAKVDTDLVEYTFWLAVFSGCMILVAAIQIGLFVWQLTLMARATKDAGQAAEAANTSANAVMLAERAYVKMSHVSPGVRWFEKNEELFEVEVEVKNHGHTPASVTDVRIGAKVLNNDELLPEPFPYSISPRTADSIPNAFLVTNETFFYTRCFPLRGQDLADVKCGGKRLWIFGHADYIDTFGKRHRSGYVRAYISIVDDGQKNNLFFMHGKQYNYDRARQKGEGSDWD